MSKIDDDRLRLIMVLSLEDQVVDRILFQEVVEAHLYEVHNIPTKAGWAPLPLGYKSFAASFPHQVYATDCSSFDWTVPEWVVHLWLQCYADTLIEPEPGYLEAVANRLEQVLGPRCIVALPDGSRYLQDGWGLMKSGWLRTISGNSEFQFLIHALAWVRSHRLLPMPETWVMGDDVAMGWDDEFDQTGFETALGTTGIQVKHGKLSREFGGFAFDGDVVTPLYPDKHLFTLGYVPADLGSQVAMAYTLMYSLADLPDWFANVHSASPVLLPTARLWARGGPAALSL